MMEQTKILSRYIFVEKYDLIEQASLGNSGGTLVKSFSKGSIVKGSDLGILPSGDPSLFFLADINGKSYPIPLGVVKKATINNLFTVQNVVISLAIIGVIFLGLKLFKVIK